MLSKILQRGYPYALVHLSYYLRADNRRNGSAVCAYARFQKNCISISYLYLPRLVESIGDNAIASIYYYDESSQGYVHARYKGVTLLVCNDSFCESYAKEMGIDYIYSVYTCGDFRYMLHYNGEAELCGCTVKDSTIAVPETLHGFPVTSINTSAFDECRATMEKGYSAVNRQGDSGKRL